MLVGYRKQNDSLFSDLNSREEDLNANIRNQVTKILVTQMPLGQSCMLFLHGHLMPIHSINDNCSDDNFKLEYPVIQ